MQKYKTTKIAINGKRFDAIIADSLIKRMIGLMFRNHLGRQQCMILSFFGEGYQSIWMYNMLFAIDVIWVAKSLKIVDVKENMHPCGSFSKCTPYIPKAKAKYVIEFSAGTLRKNKIKEGSKIRFI
jgi:uncharacterized protein